ncbi:MAG: DNA helicase UvrD [Candidatus Micrarchaeota archaeon]|nr:DNA helicase UvrD [Candidatus Micrarchaeota archaeon]
MKLIADFHIHSRYAMACSSQITIKGLDETAKTKGVGLLSTGDFTHPEWLKEIKATLEPDGEGLYRVKGSDTGVRFIIGGEVCTISKDGKGAIKKIHHCLTVPSIESGEAVIDAIKGYGALASDGRPQLSISAAGFVEKVMSVEKRAFVFPAHVWTPFFGALGSLSGCNSIKEAYEDQEKHIHALETGLSSDPEMNWMVSKNDKYALVSNSDMHSLPKMGREANVFEVDKDRLSYDMIVGSIKGKNNRIFKGTIEFYPEEGKYHFDGHRNCNYSVDPSKTKNQICPVCGKRLTIGVMHRVSDLADREYGYRPEADSEFVRIVPLREVIAHVKGKPETSKSVIELYDRMVSEIAPEFDILIDARLSDIGAVDEGVAEAIDRMRTGRIEIRPGYDGVFGEVDLLGKGVSKGVENRQRSLFG